MKYSISIEAETEPGWTDDEIRHRIDQELNRGDGIYLNVDDAVIIKIVNKKKKGNNNE